MRSLDFFAQRDKISVDRLGCPVHPRVHAFISPLQGEETGLFQNRRVHFPAPVDQIVGLVHQQRGPVLLLGEQSF
ncbi:hypothetical protein D1872_255780 [compost metagenome]